MAESEATLLGFWASPFSIRAEMALRMKGIPYEFLQEVAGTKSELLLKSNPVYQKFPVFIHKGKPVHESMIIVEYVDEVWNDAGPPILPSDPYDRAMARFWAAYIDDKLPPFTRTMRGRAEEGKAEVVEQALATLQLMEDAFQKCCRGKSFFGGDAIGYLDIALGSFLGSIRAIEEIAGVKLLDEAKVPHLVGWAERFWADEIIKGVLPRPDKLVELMKTLPV